MDENRTSIIPAEPGWRVLLTDDTRSWMAPVLAWCWSDADGTAEPLIPWEARLWPADRVAACMGGPNPWRPDTLLAPGCDHTTAADLADGWVEVPVLAEVKTGAPP